LVRPTEEDLGGQVPAQLAAEGTLDRDRPKRELLDAGRHIAVAPLAGDDENLALDGWESECHRHIIGEYEANMQNQKLGKKLRQNLGQESRQFG